MLIYLHITSYYPIILKKWLDGPIKHWIHHKAEFVILSVGLHSDDSLQKQHKKLRTIRTKIRSYSDRSMNFTTIGINFDFYPDGPYLSVVLSGWDLTFDLTAYFVLHTFLWDDFSLGLKTAETCTVWHRHFLGLWDSRTIMQKNTKLNFHWYIVKYFTRVLLSFF